MQERSLNEVFSGIREPRIAVVGDCMLDQYVWGKVERISPEGPFPVLRSDRTEVRLGGAGNVVTNLSALGAQVSFFSAVGVDPQGDTTLRLLEEAGCRGGKVSRLDGHRTTVKTRHIGYVQHADRAMQQLLRVDTEDTAALKTESAEALLEAIEAQLDDIDALLISDYNKGLLTDFFLDRLLRLAAGRVPVLTDPARIQDYEQYRGTYLICPNRYETGLATGLSCDDPERCRAAGEQLAAMYGVEYVAVTMDRDGIYLCRADGNSHHYSTQARLVTDVTGAGDMVLSMLGFVTAGGGTLAEAVRLANVAAGIAIRRMGAVPISRQELFAELLYCGYSGAVKIATLDQLRDKARDLRANGNTIVLTNGCFDLLHFGHHYLLNQARQLGDCLVVAVNSDESIRRLKGPNRPVFKENERMLMLSGLESVDYVVLFDEDTPIPLLEELRPEVLVKGSEYRSGIVVGREVVEAYGGRVELIEQVPGISTSALLERRGSAGNLG